ARGRPRGRHPQPGVGREGRPVMTGSLTLPPRALAPGAPGPAGLPRLLPAAGAVPVDLRAHLARHGPPRYAGGPGRLVAEVAAAGLTGRGGAAFPLARQLAPAAEARPAPPPARHRARRRPAHHHG